MISLHLVLHAGVIPMSTAHFGRGNATILVQDFGCTGREETLQQCTPRNYTISSYYYNGYYVFNPGPEPAILDWYGHCVRLRVNKLGGSGGMLPQENF